MSEPVKLIICIVLFLALGWRVIVKAARCIAHGDVFNEHFLMLLASVGAFCVGEPEEAVMVILLYRIGEFLQNRAVNKSRKDIDALIEGSPDRDTIEDAAAVRADSEKFITRFARVYTPVVCVLAVLVAVVPPLLFHGSWHDWIYRALSFLVVSCPCAMVISIPLSFFGGIGCASSKGVLFKGCDGIEKLAKGGRNSVDIALPGASAAELANADAVVVSEDPCAVDTAERIAKKTMSIVWQNIVFSIGIKVAVLILAAFGYSNMLLASFADSGVCILAILNSMRALRDGRL